MSQQKPNLNVKIKTYAFFEERFAFVLPVARWSHFVENCRDLIAKALGGL